MDTLTRIFEAGRKWFLAPLSRQLTEAERRVVLSQKEAELRLDAGLDELKTAIGEAAERAAGAVEAAAAGYREKLDEANRRIAALEGDRVDLSDEEARVAAAVASVRQIGEAAGGGEAAGDTKPGAD